MSAAPTRLAAPFQTAAELGFVVPGDEGPSALPINPETGMAPLLAPIQTNVYLRRQCLKGWHLTEANHDASPEQIVGPALDLAEQFDLVLSKVVARRPEGRAA